MTEILKTFNECVFSLKYDKMERLNKLDNLRKTLFSEFESHHDNIKNLFQLFDDISLKAFDKSNYHGKDSASIRDNGE